MMTIFSEYWFEILLSGITLTILILGLNSMESPLGKNYKIDEVIDRFNLAYKLCPNFDERDTEFRYSGVLRNYTRFNPLTIQTFIFILEFKNGSWYLNLYSTFSSVCDITNIDENITNIEKFKIDKTKFRKIILSK